MKAIKTTLNFLLILFLSSKSFGQNTSLPIDSLYENKDEFLIYTKIQEFDSISKSQFPQKIKNWAGKKFVKMNEVLVSETEDQLVFVYISKAFFLKGLMGEKSGSNDWYIRMIVQMKDNKIRITMYDDGNAMNEYRQARSSKLSNCFNKKGLAPNLYIDGLVNLKKSCVELSNDLIDGIKKDAGNTKDDW
jgi:hypothetical protein